MKLSMNVIIGMEVIMFNGKLKDLIIGMKLNKK
jgi:hypothetical protein